MGGAGSREGRLVGSERADGKDAAPTIEIDACRFPGWQREHGSARSGGRWKRRATKVSISICRSVTSRWKSMDQERKAEPHKSRIPSASRRLYEIGREPCMPMLDHFLDGLIWDAWTVETGESHRLPRHKCASPDSP